MLIQGTHGSGMYLSTRFYKFNKIGGKSDNLLLLPQNGQLDMESHVKYATLVNVPKKID